MESEISQNEKKPWQLSATVLYYSISVISSSEMIISSFSRLGL